MFVFKLGDLEVVTCMIQYNQPSCVNHTAASVCIGSYRIGKKEIEHYQDIVNKSQYRTSASHKMKPSYWMIGILDKISSSKIFHKKRRSPMERSAECQNEGGANWTRPPPLSLHLQAITTVFIHADTLPDSFYSHNEQSSSQKNPVRGRLAVLLLSTATSSDTSLFGNFSALSLSHLSVINICVVLCCAVFNLVFVQAFFSFTHTNTLKHTPTHTTRPNTHQHTHPINNERGICLCVDGWRDPVRLFTAA